MINPLSIKELMVESHKTAVEHGWWDKERNLGEQLLLWVSEISEAFEEYRDGHGLTEIYFRGDGKPEGFPIECADLLIRFFDTMENYGIDIDNALAIKMAFNKTRPYKHGGKRA